MIEGLIKIAGSLFIGGIGLMLILMAALIFIVISKEVAEWIKDKT